MQQLSIDDILNLPSLHCVYLPSCPLPSLCLPSIVSTPFTVSTFHRVHSLHSPSFNFISFFHASPLLSLTSLSFDSYPSPFLHTNPFLPSLPFVQLHDTNIPVGLCCVRRDALWYTKHITNRTTTKIDAPGKCLSMWICVKFRFRPTWAIFVCRPWPISTPPWDSSTDPSVKTCTSAPPCHTPVFHCYTRVG